MRHKYLRGERAALILERIECGGGATTEELLLITLLEVLEMQTRTESEVKKIMSQIDDLNAAVQAVSDDVDKVSTDVTSVLDLLKQNPPDVSGAIAKLTTVDTTLKSIDSGLTAVLPPAPAP